MFVGGPNVRKDYHINEGEEVRAYARLVVHVLSRCMCIWHVVVWLACLDAVLSVRIRPMCTPCQVPMLAAEGSGYSSAAVLWVGKDVIGGFAIPSRPFCHPGRNTCIHGHGAPHYHLLVIIPRYRVIDIVHGITMYMLQLLCCDCIFGFINAVGP